MIENTLMKYMLVEASKSFRLINIFKSALPFVLLFFVFAFKSDNFIIERRVYAKGNFFTADNLGNFYLVGKDEISKYDANGNVFNKFSIKAFGNIESIDVSNPMKILVFYKDFSKIVFLDNTLSLNGSMIDLEENMLNQSRLACYSYNDGIWVYDQQKFELLRLDKNLSVSNNTGNLNQLLGIDIVPDFLTEYNNCIYLNNPSTGILVFDVYGTYLKTIPLLHLRKFQISNQEILYIEDSAAVSYNLTTKEISRTFLPPNKYSECRRIKGLLYAKNEDYVDMLKPVK